MIQIDKILASGMGIDFEKAEQNAMRIKLDQVYWNLWVIRYHC